MYLCQNNKDKQVNDNNVAGNSKRNQHGSNAPVADDLLCINGTYFQVEVEALEGYVQETDDNNSSPSSQPQQHRHLIILKDMTALRAREAAEKAAETEALRAQAMHGSMQALSHELRTPLQGIMGVTSLILANRNDHQDGSTNNKMVPSPVSMMLDEQDVMESLSMIMASARLLLTLINNMLDVRKCDSAMMDAFQLGSVDLQRSIQDTMEFCMPAASLSGIQLQIVQPITPSLLVHSNALRLQQIMVNLVSNAIKYTRSGGHVTIFVEEMSLSEAQDAMNKALVSSYHQQQDDTDDNPNDDNDPADDVTQQDQQRVAVISVSDSGIGIPVEQSGQLFQEFSQLSMVSSSDSDVEDDAGSVTSATTTGSSLQSQDHQPVNKIGGRTSSGTAQPTGTGLGLNLCLKFVRRMNGHIWAQNNNNNSINNNDHDAGDGPGACFSFYLPLVPASMNRVVSNPTLVNLAVATQPQPQQNFPRRADLSSRIPNDHPSETNNTIAAAPPKMAASDYRILVVDDVAINRKVVSRMLERAGVQKVVAVEGGKEALAELAKTNQENSPGDNESYNMVLTDLSMPEMDGTELCREILKRNTLNSPKPIVVGLTAEVSESVDAECIESGMIQVLHKPITIDQIREFLVQLAESNSIA